MSGKEGGKRTTWESEVGVGAEAPLRPSSGVAEEEAGDEEGRSETGGEPRAAVGDQHGPFVAGQQAVVEPGQRDDVFEDGVGRRQRQRRRPRQRQQPPAAAGAVAVDVGVAAAGQPPLQRQRRGRRDPGEARRLRHQRRRLAAEPSQVPRVIVERQQIHRYTCHYGQRRWWGRWKLGSRNQVQLQQASSVVTPTKAVSN